MRWNIVELTTNGSYARVFRGFLVVVKGGEELGKAVLDELNCVLLTGQQLTLSKPLMVRLAEENIPIVICGNNYHPVSITLSYGQHHQSQKVIQAQVSASAPLVKRLWQQVIRRKILHQSQVLAVVMGQAEATAPVKLLQRLSKTVGSGDPDNKEAQAARIYWQALMGNDFRRNTGSTDRINTSLNYGYTVLRAACARAVVAAGLIPAIGIHHHNQNNPFCLADDIMEVFRPLVDLHVASSANSMFDAEEKRQLAGILQDYVEVDGRQLTVANATQHLANSIATSFLQKRIQIVLPMIENKVLAKAI